MSSKFYIDIYNENVLSSYSQELQCYKYYASILRKKTRRKPFVFLNKSYVYVILKKKHDLVISFNANNTHRQMDKVVLSALNLHL